MSIMRGESAGFTLVELLVTMVVGGLLAGSVTLLLNQHTHLSQRGRDVSTANSFVENKVEALRSAGYLSIPNGTTDITSDLPDELKDSRTASLTVTDQTDSIKKVEVSITYNDQGTQRTYSYTTFVGELGVGQY